MSKERKDIEDFLKEKLDNFDSGYERDWPEFEEKLDRAYFFHRLKMGALVSVVLILISLGIFGTSAFVGTEGTDEVNAESSRAYYQQRQNPVAVQESRQHEQQNPRIKEEQGRLQPQGSQHTSDENINKNTSGATASPKTSDQVITMAGASEALPDNSSVPGSGSNVKSRSANIPMAEDKLADNAASSDGPVSTSKTAPAGRRRVMLIEESDFPAPDEHTEVTSAQPSGVVKTPPVERTSKAITVSLQLNTEDLDKSLKQGEASELHVRPPVMPVEFKRPGPYVSPMQENNPWSYALLVYPNFTFRKFKVDKEKLSYIHRDFIDATQAAERGGFSLNIGLRISRRIGDITYINSGVEYINYKTQAEFDFTNYRAAQIDEATNRITHYSVKRNPEHISFVDNNVYHYLNVPVSISHQPWATDHIRLNIEAGASFMYFLGARGKSINYRSLEIIDISQREYRNSIGAFHMKVGATYHLSAKFNFGLEPTMMYFTNTIYTEEYPFQVIPYSVGVNLKLQVKLN